jgi:4-amino-4-deoxy-L-arabinose transferase-like glycosyltransferase
MGSGQPLYRRDGLLCALLMAACFLLARPFAEIGFIDDWSYIKTAQVFAQTGHFAYNGWATATLGWQVLLGALFSKLFGFSFVHVRLSTLLVAVGTVYVFHQNLVRFGISRGNAAFGALTLGLSPIFMAMSASYMTDVPGLFCTLLCLYLCQRALSAPTDGSVLVWLCLAVVTNVIGGTARQTIWLGVLLIVPSALWLLRRRRSLFWSGVLLWLAGVVGVFFCMHWLNNQPYFLPNSLFPQGSARSLLKRIVIKDTIHVIKTFLCVLLLVFPVLAAWLPLARSLPRRPLLWLSLLSSVLLAAFLIYASEHGELNSFTAPWLSHVIDSMGGLGGTGDILGPKPVIVHYWQRTIVTVLVLASGLVFFLHLFSQLRLQARVRQTAAPVWHQMFYLTMPYTLGYLGAVFIRGATDPVFDRYLLTLQAIGIAFLLRYYQDFAAPNREQPHSKFSIGPIPVVSYLALLIFAYFAIAGIHDWFALQRARVEATEEVRRAGVPRTAIQGGFEYDGWTQLEVGGYINDPRIKIPRDAFHVVPLHLDLPPECGSWFYFMNLTPVIVPQYFVVFAPVHCFAPSPFPAVAYHNWMPPFTRYVYVQQRRD